MGPLGFVALFAAELLLGEALKALRPKPKPEKVKRPTAEEDTVIPLVFGTAVIRPNVIAWGDTSSEDVGDDKYAYYARMALGLCEGPIDELVDLVIGGKSIALWTPTKTTSGDDEIVGTSSKLTYVTSHTLPVQRATIPGGVDFYVSALDLFGGRKGTKLIPGNNALGGVAGVVGVHWGTVGDPVDDLVTHLLGADRASAFPGLAYLTLGGDPDTSWPFQLSDGRFYFGTTPNLPDFLVVVRAFPQALLGSAADSRVGIDANPAEVIYQALTDVRRGMGVPATDVDTVQFTAEAEGFATEGFGVSGQLESPEQAIDLIDDICRAADAVVFLDPETSLVSMKRMRQDYTLSDCLAISTSNCDDFSMTQPTAEQVTNEVRVQFRRYTGGVAGTVTGEAMSLVTTIIGLYGLFQLQGRNVSDLTIYDEDLDRTLTAGEFSLTNPHLGIVFVTNNDDDNGTEIYNHNLTASYVAVPEDATFKDAVTPPEQDLANIELTGVVRAETIDAPFISNDLTARLVAQRMLRKLSTPLAPATFSVSRQGHALKPGDVVRVTWPEYSLSDSPFRISSAAWDEDPGGKIRCTAVADVFGTELQLIASDDGLASPGVDTPATLTAPGINLAYVVDSSIRVALFPQDTSFTITLERADSADFATGSTVLSSTITGTTTYYDDTVTTGTPYYYRAFLHRLGYVDGPYSAVLAATGVTGTPSTVVTAVMPTISEVTTQDTLSGTLTLTITDPQVRVTAVEFKTQAGLSPETAYAEDTATPYSATVAISTAGSSVITYRVTYTDADGNDATIERAVGFNTPATDGAVVLWQADSRYPAGKVLTAGDNVMLDTTSTAGLILVASTGDGGGGGSTTSLDRYLTLSGELLADGDVVDIPLMVDGVITEVELFADAPVTASADVLACTDATATTSLTFSSIIGTATVGLTGQQRYVSTALSGWTALTHTAGTTLRLSCSTIGSASYLVLSLKYKVADEVSASVVRTSPLVATFHVAGEVHEIPLDNDVTALAIELLGDTEGSATLEVSTATDATATLTYNRVDGGTAVSLSGTQRVVDTSLTGWTINWGAGSTLKLRLATMGVGLSRVTAAVKVQSGTVAGAGGFGGTVAVGTFPVVVGAQTLGESELVNGTDNIEVGRSLMLQKGLVHPPATATADVTLSHAQYLVVVTADAAINLPAAASALGRAYQVVPTGGATATLTPSGSETIGGSATLAITTGTIIVCDGTGWLVVATAGGGGAATGSVPPLYNPHVDAFPSSPDARDDEFDGTSSASWAWYNQHGAVATATGSVLKLVAGTSTGAALAMYGQTVSGNFIVTAKLLSFGGLTNYASTSLCVRDNATGRYEQINVHNRNSVSWTLNVDRRTDSAWVSSDYGPTQLTGLPLGGLYLQIEANASNVIFRYSLDGEHWKQMYSVARGSLYVANITHVGLGIDQDSGGASSAFWDYVRFS